MATSDFHALCTGFESNVVACELGASTAAHTIISASPAPKAGTYCLKIDTFNNTTDSRWKWIIPEIPNYTTLSFSLKFDVQISATPTKATDIWFQLGPYQLNIDTNKKITLTGGGVSSLGSTVLNINQWYRFELVMVRNDKTYFRIDGADEVNVPLGTIGPPLFSGGTDNSGKGGTGYGFYTYVDDLVLLYVNRSNVQTPWIGAQTVANIFPGAEGNYADSVVTGVAHPNAYQNVNDYNLTTNYNTLGSNSVIKRDTYKDNAAITLTSTNVFNGFSSTLLYRANNSPSAVPPLLIRDNSVDIIDGRAAGTSETLISRGYYKYRPSDDTVTLTKEMLENTSGSNIEYGLYVPVQSGGTMTLDIISQWVSYFQGAAMTDITPAPPKVISYQEANQPLFEKTRVVAF